MPGGFGHLIGAWLCGKAYNKYFGKLTKLMWLALLFGSILPDADFFIDWTIRDLYVHRTFTHSFSFVFFAGIIAYIILAAYNHCLSKKMSSTGKIAICLSFGILTHIIFDLSLSSYGLQVLWPFDKEWITLNGPLNHEDGPPSYARLKFMHELMVIDVGLGISWLAYLFWRNKIRFD